MDILILVLLAALSLAAISLLKTYRQLPAKELKRLARSKDPQAAAMYKAAAYQSSLFVLLWFLVGMFAALFFWFVSSNTPTIVAVFLSAVLLWYGFVWMPGRNTSGYSKSMAAFLAPAFAWILQYSHAAIDFVVRFAHRHWPVVIHTGLYDKEDLLELLRYQAAQPDNQINPTELDMAAHALTVGDKLVRDRLTPKRMVKMVSADDTIGPVLMDELHASGFSRFPVYEGKKSKIVGTLFLRDLVRGKTGGHVSKMMREDVFYVHEEQPLTDALQAILKTRHHLLIVVNSFEEFVGVLSIEDVLEQIVGTPIIDEFDQYDDLRAVAKRAAAKEHAANKEPVPPTEEPTEVVE